MRKNIRNKLLKLEKQLLSTPPIKMLPSSKSKHNEPLSRQAGVYAIRRIGTGLPVYLGESSSFHSRMADLRRSENHTFRKKAAEEYEIEAENEPALSKSLSRMFRVSFLPVDFGRKELEEFLVVRWQDVVLNKPAIRLQQSMKDVPALTQSEREEILRTTGMNSLH